MQMAQAGFAEDVLQTLEDVRAPLDHIMLEVTESALLDVGMATTSLWTLRSAGVRLALDDFGTGYASFSYLRRFPIDVIKIDRSFTAGLGEHADDDAIVSAIVSLARQTDKAVIAEGVETHAQAEILRELGVSQAQGYLWAKPLPKQKITSWLDSPAADVEVPKPRRAPPLHDVRRSSQEAVGIRISRMHAAGSSLHTIAAALNGTGQRTLRGTRWHPTSVAQVLAAG